MDRQKLNHHRTVQDLLTNWPGTAGVFVALKTNCVGCYLARFCSLADVATTYDLTVDDLMEKLQHATHETVTLKTGESHETNSF